jgi:hypothetical protein
MDHTRVSRIAGVSLIASSVLLPCTSCVVSEPASGGRAEALLAGPLGEAQIGVGRLHDPAWVTQYGGPGDEQGEGIAVSRAGLYIGGDTTSAWFGAFNDPCSAAAPHEGEDCADGFIFSVWAGVGVQIGNMQSDAVKALALDGTGLYVAAKFREGPPGYKNDAYAMKYSLDLQMREWGATIRNPRKVDEFLGIAVDGDVFACGGSSARVGPDPHIGDEDMIVMKIDATGTVVATEQIGSTGFEELMGVAVDADAVYSVGQTAGALGCGPALGSRTDALLVISDRSLESTLERCRVQFGSGEKDVAQTVIVNGDHVYVAGYTDGVVNGLLRNGATCNQDSHPPSDAFRTDAWLAKYDKSCQHVWTRQFGTKDGDVGSKLATDGSHIFITGNYGTQSPAHGGSTASTHAFVRGYDLDGNLIGEVRLDSGDQDVGQALVVHAGIVYVTGGTYGTLGQAGSNLGGRDVFLAQIPIAELTSGVASTGTGCGS